MYLKTKRLLSLLLALTMVMSLFMPITAEASEQEEGGLPSLVESSAEEYALSKQAYVLQSSGAENEPVPVAELDGHIMSNEFIEYAVDLSNGRFTVGTTGGNPELASDDDKLMLFGHSDPSTSYTTVYTDGTAYIYGGNGFVTEPYFEPASRRVPKATTPTM